MLGHNQLSDGSQPVAVVEKKRRFRGSQPVQSLSQVSIGDMNIAAKRPSLFLFTMMVLYDQLYLLGMTLLRRNRRFMRRLRLVFSRVAGGFYSGTEQLSGTLSRTGRSIGRRVTSPYVRARDYFRRQKPLVAQAKEAGQIPWSAYGNMAWYVARMFWRLCATVFNYAAPVAAAVLLVTQISQSYDVTMGLRVSYVIDGEVIDLGYVESEMIYEQATMDVRDRLISAGDFQFASSTPQFVLEEVDSKNVFVEVEELANRIIQASGVDIETAYGFYVSGQLLGAVEDKDALYSELEDLKAANASGKTGERFDFDKSISIKEGLYPTSSIVSLNSIKNVLNTYDTQEELYEVQQNDTPSTIADRFGIDYSLFLEMNPGVEDSLPVGSQVRTAVARPFLSVKTIYTDVYNEEFDYEVIETQNATYARGYREVDQPGVKGLQQVTAEITTINGIEIGREVLNTSILVEPIAERVTVGVNNPQSIVSGPTTSSSAVTGDMTPSAQTSAGFIWPTSSGYISCYLGGYPGHTGIDIADKAGAPIYAAASGTVTLSKATWTGYGHYIMIDHGNGFETLYGHNSVLYVSVGDVVQQGQVIALMGRTGRATGNHVHFEVKYNGKVMNPVDYVGDRRR